MQAVREGSDELHKAKRKPAESTSKKFEKT